ncbi:hypothetical protein HC766_02585 [Candidatus Gracilibacteria bacterium]|nr:hypothetical protein [Candidatus Gracilibacteria bacterium]
MDKEEFLEKIFETESRRTFDEGWDHCKSSFSFSPKEGWNWEYKTTSGTILRASQRVFGYSHQLPEIAFEVEIPEARAKRGRTHYSYLQIALANLPYMRWIQYQKEDTDTKIRIVNILSGKSRAKEEGANSVGTSGKKIKYPELFVKPKKFEADIYFHVEF